MKIPLSEGYFYKDIAEESEGILYIHRLESFHRMMYDIMYENAVEELRCAYCGKFLPREAATIDHIYPASLGGPYLPDNFCFSCKHCNNEKEAMLKTHYDYYIILSKEEKQKYRSSYKKITKQLMKQTPVMPRNWYTYEKITKIIPINDSAVTKSLKKAREHFDLYGRLNRICIVDKNYLLLDGYAAYLIAIEKGLEKIPVIVLENVILEY